MIFKEAAFVVQSYQWEALSPQLFLCTSPKHRFGIDAFLLSDFVQVRRRDRAVDLGTGCGIVPLLWFREGGPQLAYGVDLRGMPSGSWSSRSNATACRTG